MSINRFRILAAVCSLLLFATACGSEAATDTAELPTIESSTTVPDAAADSPDSDAATNDTDTVSSDDPSDGEPVDPEIAMAEYEKCMSDQGIEMEMAVMGAEGGSGFETLDAPIDSDAGLDAPTEGITIDDEDFQAAEEVCGPILEDAFGSFEFTPEQEAEIADQMLELERCLADQGFEIDTDGGAFELDPDIDFEAFQSAMSACGNEADLIGVDG